MFRDYSLRWCDTTISALGNRKPRTLVRTEAGTDFGLIRGELGLPTR